MNLLIVDDKPARYEALVRRLKTGILNLGTVDLATSVSDALEKMKVKQYEILVVDMLLPIVAWGQEEPDGGAQLLEHIREDDELYVPNYIVGITAAEEDAEQVEVAFASSPWVLLRDRPGLPDWEPRLETLISHAIAIEREESSSNYSSDICILTALKTPEYAALLRSGIAWSDPKLMDSSTYVQQGVLQSRGRDLSVVVAYCSRMGSTESTLMAAKLIRAYQPRLFALTGICAGYEERTSYGDVVVGNPVWDHAQSSKLIVDEKGVKRVEVAPDFIEVDRDIVARFNQLADDSSFLLGVHTGWPAEKPHAPPRLHVKPSATGFAVVADGETLKSIKSTQHRDLYGFEMEAYGVYCAARIARRPRPLVFSAKSVCDFGNYLKNDKYQAYAAYCSTSVVIEFLKRFGGELVQSTSR